MVTIRYSDQQGSKSRQKVIIYDRMGVNEGNLQVIDVDTMLENCPIIIVILNL